MPTAKTVRKADSTTTKKAAKKPAQRTAKKVTFEDVWAGLDRLEKLHEETEKAIKETQEAHKETERTLNELGMSHKETERSLNELGMSRKETERSLNEIKLMHKETERSLNGVNLCHQETEKTLNRAIGGLSNTLGSLVEHIMTPGLPGKFKPFGFTFERITTVKWAAEGNIYAEIDGLLENGSQAMVVEVKTTLRRADIDDHLERMEKVRRYADDHGDKREFRGAMATTITDKDTKEYALSKGFFVIEPSGEDVKITKPVSEKVW